MAKMNWDRARQRPAGSSWNDDRLDRQTDRWLGNTTQLSKPRSPQRSQHDEITITDGMNPDGTLRVFRFKSKAEYLAWQRAHPRSG